MDDSVPVGSASLGSAVSHYFGGEIEFLSLGAYSIPIDKSLKELDFSKIKYNPKNKWIKHQIEMIKYFVENSEGLFPVTTTEIIMGLVFVDFLRRKFLDQKLGGSIVRN